MNSRPSDLKLDWCSHAAAKYAVEHWHYSRSLPPPPHNCVGVWEGGRYVGCVIFSKGANRNLLAPFGLTGIEGCELTRVALTGHRTPVTRIISVAIRFLRQRSPGLRLIVSFADPSQGHVGAIYQAGNWIYTGKSRKQGEYLGPDGNRWHRRMVKKQGWTTCFGRRQAALRPDQCVKIMSPGKHRYLFPLEDEIRARVLKLAKPYPKRPKDQAPTHQAGLGGETPTRPLQSLLSAYA